MTQFPPIYQDIGYRVSILSKENDNQIEEIYNKMDRENLAGSMAEVLSLFETRPLTGMDIEHMPERGHRALDLIGHTAQVDTAEGDEGLYLTIGDWTMSSLDEIKTFCEQMSPLLERMRISKLRLLGCSTATTAGGWAVIQALAQYLDVEVFGTKWELDAGNYDRQGFQTYPALHSSRECEKAPSRLFDLASAPRPGMKKELVPEMLVRERLVQERLTPRSKSRWRRSVVDRARATSIWQHVVPDIAWSLPGLLARPVREVLIPVGDDEVQRVQIMLQYQTVRVFPPSHEKHGLVYRVKNPAALKAWLASLH